MKYHSTTCRTRYKGPESLFRRLLYVFREHRARTQLYKNRLAECQQQLRRKEDKRVALENRLKRVVDVRAERNYMTRDTIRVTLEIDRRTMLRTPEIVQEVELQLRQALRKEFGV